MNMMQGDSERRKHPRFRTLPHQSYILLQEERKTGELIDISMGGVAFHYLSEKSHPCGGYCLSTLLGVDDLCLTEVGMMTVADQVIAPSRQGRYPFLRRRSVEFTGLTPDQRSILKQFIWLNTREEKMPVSLQHHHIP